MTTKPEIQELVATPLDFSMEKHVNDSITDGQITAAISAFKELFPNDTHLAAVSEAELHQRVRDFLKSTEVFTPHLDVPASRVMESDSQQTSCPMAIAIVLVDCSFMVLGFVGLRATYSARLKRQAALAIGEDVARDLPGWIKLVNNLKLAENPMAKAKAIFDIARATYKAGMFRGILGEIAGTMTWQDWAITGVAAIAQIGVLFLTDGLAFVAELALNAAAVAFVVSDSVEACEACQ
jgi:hypothetical protein